MKERIRSNALPITDQPPRLCEVHFPSVSDWALRRGWCSDSKSKQPFSVTPHLKSPRNAQTRAFFSSNSVL